jgi:hypothetical protein
MTPEEQALAPAAPSEEQLLDAALEAQNLLKTGYAEGEGHTALASQHQLIRDANGTEVHQGSQPRDLEGAACPRCLSTDPHEDAGLR